MNEWLLQKQKLSSSIGTSSISHSTFYVLLVYPAHFLISLPLNNFSFSPPLPQLFPPKQLSVLNVLSYLIERVGVSIRPFCSDLVHYLPALWEASDEHNMLRCSILTTLVFIVQVSQWLLRSKKEKKSFVVIARRSFSYERHCVG